MVERSLKQKLGSFIIDHLGLGMFRYDVESDSIDYVNFSFCELLGYEAQKDMKVFSLLDLFKNPEYGKALFNTLNESKFVRRYQAILKKSDDTKLWVSITASLVTYEDENNKTFIEGIVEDINQQKEFEEKLGLEQNALQSLLDNLPDAVYFKDKDHCLIRVNRFYAEGFGMIEEEIIGKTDFDFFPEQQAKEMQTDDEYVLRTGKPIVGKIEKTLLPNGEWNQVITTKIPVVKNNGKIVGTMGITRDITDFSRVEEEKVQMSVNAIKALSKALEMKDPYTFGHASRVSTIVECIAQEMGWKDNEILGMKLAAQLHDVGKIVVPIEILAKPGKLSALEYQMIQEHVQNCYDILKDIHYPFPLTEAIYQHHERLDGTGYPRGLKGKEIIKEARMLAVADVLEAMTCHRPYREALGVDVAIEELNEGMGTRYDPEIAQLAIKLIHQNNNKPFWEENQQISEEAIEAIG